MRVSFSCRRKRAIERTFGIAFTDTAAVGLDKLGQVGVLYKGLEVLAGGAILTGMILGAIGAFIVDKKYQEASAFALAGAVLTFFGFMHGESVGIAVTPVVALAYALVSVFLFGLSRSLAVAPEQQPQLTTPTTQPAPAG